MVENNVCIELEDIDDADANVTYLQPINKDEQLRFHMVKLMIDWNPVWKWDEDDENSMKNACDDSFSEGTVEYIAYDILNKMIHNEQGCNLEEVAPWLRSYQMKFKKPIYCGSYTLDIWLKTPIGHSAGRIFFDWTIPEGSNCLPDIEPIE